MEVYGKGGRRRKGNHEGNRVAVPERGMGNYREGRKLEGVKKSNGKKEQQQGREGDKGEIKAIGEDKKETQGVNGRAEENDEARQR